MKKNKPPHFLAEDKKGLESNPGGRPPGKLKIFFEKNPGIKILLRYLPPLIWMALIFYASSRPRIGVSGSFWLSFIFFKTLHLIEYGVLFSLWRLSLYNISYSQSISIAISVIYGITDELHQALVPTREGRVRDVLIDFLGVLILGQFFLNILKKLIKENMFLRSIFFSSE
ncbi:MAG: VanZ family protein [Patescibacteria group bacterium]|nr:VanZ family protein [Patescibacteria group bacterium]